MTSYKVLIVDDSQIIRKMIRRSLVLGESKESFFSNGNKTSFEINEAENGLVAWNTIQSHKYDMIITDLNMPEMDGMTLIRNIRKDADRFREIPILFLTAIDDLETKTEAFRLGATDYITKPFLPEELKARVLGYLERGSAYRTIVDELNQARVIQESLNPERNFQIKNIKCYCQNFQMEQIGGDYFDIFPLDDERLGMMIGDVSGHGIPAALIVFMISGIFKYYAQNENTPLKAISKLNDFLESKIPDGKFSSMLFGQIEHESKKYTYCNAGHPAAIHISPKLKQIEFLDSESSLLGLFDSKISSFEEKSIQLNEGDKIIYYTDGILEVSEKNELHITQQDLKDFFSVRIDEKIETTIDQLIDFSKSRSTFENPNDDRTVLGIEVL